MKRLLLALLLTCVAEMAAGQIGARLFDGSNSQNWMRPRAAQPEMEFVDTLSRWSVGVETGISVDAECGFCSYHQGSTYSVPLAVRAEYRLLRWLSFPVQLGYNYLNDKGRANLRHLDQPSSWGIFDLSYQLQVLSISAGPKLMVRLGQGDLGFSFRYGLARRSLRQEVNTSGQPPISIAYRSNWGSLQALRLSYAYWPVERLAIELSGELFAVYQAQHFVPVQSQESLFPGMPQSAREMILRPVEGELGFGNSKGPFLSNFLIGIHYRL